MSTAMTAPTWRRAWTRIFLISSSLRLSSRVLTCQAAKQEEAELRMGSGFLHLEKHPRSKWGLDALL